MVVRRTITIFVRKSGEVVILGGGEQECKTMWVRSERGLRQGGELERWVGAEGIKVVELRRAESEKMEIEL